MFEHACYLSKTAHIYPALANSYIPSPCQVHECLNLPRQHKTLTRDEISNDSVYIVQNCLETKNANFFI